MTQDTGLIMLHQLLFQGMFFAKNLVLRQKLGQPIRGNNLEANLSIAFFVIFIGIALWLSLGAESHRATGLAGGAAQALAGLFMLASLVIAAASLKDLGESWRVGVIEEQETKLIETGVYRFSRNPYFLAYLLMFAAYTTLLQSILLLVLSVIGFGMVHTMIMREERYLVNKHAADYERYQNRVPRYMNLKLRKGKKF